MTEKKRSCDAVEWAYNRYIKGKPELEAYFEELGVQSDLAQQVYDIRNKLHMSREDLAEFSGLTSETIEDIEESDYETVTGVKRLARSTAPSANGSKK
jgi:DNA-binding XRE family transcriptional regulator